MCLQLEDLIARLGEHSQLRHIGIVTPVSVVSGFKGNFDASCGDFSLTSTNSSTTCGGETLQRKIAWARQSAPMVELTKAIELLLAAFWGQACDGLGRSTCSMFRVTQEAQDVHVTPQDLQGPWQLDFLEVHDREYTSAPREVKPPESKVIPNDLQDIVLQWFHLFCFELSSLGYCVSHHCREILHRHYQNTYSLRIAV